MKILIAIGMSLLVSACNLSVYADEDEAPKITKAVKNEAYLTECGACHFAYQPKLLPKSTWQKMMTSSALADHFGESAELPEEDRVQIENFLLVGAGRGKNGPLRITDTKYFRHDHDEISRRYVQDNPKVNSFSNCDSCHTKAAKGDFDEDFVVIPGFGRWDD